jgi:hypothetical protein
VLGVPDAPPPPEPEDSTVSPSRRFLEERAEVDGLEFLEPRGYWANTYVPGDRELRELQLRLAGWDRSSLGDPSLHDRSRRVTRPYDPPVDAALAVYLRADRRGITARERMLVEVGLKGTARRTGRRPAMNVGIVLDLRGELELDRLVLSGQGNRRLLHTAADARGLVDRELAAAGRTVARVIRLNIRLAPGVQLVDVVGSTRLDEQRAQLVRDAETSIDRRMAVNFGIIADRGLDEDGLQVVIPAFYAEDAHAVLLDVVVPGPGPVVEVSARYKDLVNLRNGSARAQLSLGRDASAAGPLETAVLKGLLAHRLGKTLESAGAELSGGRINGAKSC